METIIRNKLIILPISYSKEDYSKQIKEVADFCKAKEDGVEKNISFSKIAPKTIEFGTNTKEEDDWLLRNWGTRTKPLNACWVTDNELIFDTFWNPAIPIFIKLIKKFPHIRFAFKFASKRTGQKAGEINASEGKIIYFKRYKSYSKEAYEMAFELMPHLTMLYTYNQKTGTYDYDTTDFRATIEQKGFYKEDDGTILIGTDDKRKPLFDSTSDLPF